jgi:hypothetical protein
VASAALPPDAITSKMEKIQGKPVKHFICPNF